MVRDYPKFSVCLSHMFFLWLVRAFLDLPYYNREAFWSCLFLLIDFYLCNRPEEMFGRELNLRNILVLVIFGRAFELRIFFCHVLDLRKCLLVKKKIIKKNNNKIIGLVLTAAERHYLVLRLS